jgi:DNA polymerase III delta subunit
MAKGEENEVYLSYISQMKKSDVNVVVFSGSRFWKLQFLDRVCKALESPYRSVTTDLKQRINSMRFRPLIHSHHVIDFEISKSFPKADAIILKDHFKKIPPGGILIIYLADYKAKRQFFKEFPAIRKNRSVITFEMEWLPVGAISDFYNKLAIEQGIAFSTTKARWSFTTRIGDHFDEVVPLLHHAGLLENPISEDTVKAVVPDYSTYSTLALFNCLAGLTKKRVPFQMLQDLLDGTGTATSVVNRAIEFFRLVMQAKTLKLKGVLRNGCIIRHREKIFKQLGITLSEPTLFSLTDFKISSYMEVADTLTLTEIIMIQLALEECLIIEDNGSRRTTDLALYATVSKILSRRGEDGIRSDFLPSKRRKTWQRKS